MKHRYSQTGSRGMGMILRSLGFIFAMILMIGMLDKAGLKISIEGEERSPNSPRYNEAAVGDNHQERDNRSSTVYVSPDEPAQRYQENYQPRPYNNHSRTAPSRGTQAPASAKDFINRFAETATAQALNRGVPAGISLALGIDRLNRGEQFDSWQDFMDKVIMPLARIKENAAHNGLQPYFKYSANSNRWLEGLSRQGDYSYNSLRQAMHEYRLERYDEEVRTALVEGTRVTPEVERQASYVADEVNSHIVSQRVSNEQANRSSRTRTAKTEEWQNYYDETVGREVAKEVAKRKLNTGQYITEEDMNRLIDEANVETKKVLKNNLSFLGREINRDHPDAPEMLDITKSANAQARQELYQKKIREQKFAGNR